MTNGLKISFWHGARLWVRLVPFKLKVILEFVVSGFLVSVILFILLTKLTPVAISDYQQSAITPKSLAVTYVFGNDLSPCRLLKLLDFFVISVCSYIICGIALLLDAVWRRSSSLTEIAEVRRELHEATAKLLEEEKSRQILDRRYKLLFEYTGTATAIIDTKSLRIVEVNKRFERLVGHFSDELRDTFLWEYTSDNNVQVFRALLERFKESHIRPMSLNTDIKVRSGRVINVILTMAGVNGTYIIVSLIYIPRRRRIGQIMTELYDLPSDAAEVAADYQKRIEDHDKKFDPYTEGLQTTEAEDIYVNLHVLKDFEDTESEDVQ